MTRENRLVLLVEQKTLTTKVKNSIDLHISPLADWREEDNVFFKSLSERR